MRRRKEWKQPRGSRGCPLLYAGDIIFVGIAGVSVKKRALHACVSRDF